MLIKRYGVPLAVSLALYSLLYVLAGDGVPYWNPALLWAVLLSYLIRLCDDLGDYEADAAAGKAPVGKKTLFALTGLTLLILILTALLARGWWVLLPAALISGTLAVPGKGQWFLKPLFVPTILLSLAATSLRLNIWVYILSAAMLAGDVLLICIKEKRHDSR